MALVEFHERRYHLTNMKNGNGMLTRQACIERAVEFGMKHGIEDRILHVAIEAYDRFFYNKTMWFAVEQAFIVMAMSLAGKNKEWVSTSLESLLAADLAGETETTLKELVSVLKNDVELNVLVDDYTMYDLVESMAYNDGLDIKNLAFYFAELMQYNGGLREGKENGYTGARLCVDLARLYYEDGEPVLKDSGLFMADELIRRVIELIELFKQYDDGTVQHVNIKNKYRSASRSCVGDLDLCDFFAKIRAIYDH